jgi:PleD family two-component response regulator
MTSWAKPPVMPEGDAGSAAASATSGPTLRDGSKAPVNTRILIVEDDVSLGKFLSRALKQKLFSVEISLDGEVAWEALQSSTYDLVILDLNLPGMDGMELLKRVRLTHCWC